MPRTWRVFPKRFIDQVNTTSGIAGLGGLGLSAIGAVVAAPVILAAGVTFTAAVAGWCFVKAIPPKMRTPSTLAGKTITDLADLADVNPPLRRIGVLGPTRVGKTTLLARLQMDVPSDERTENPYACVVVIPGSNTHVAIIDAAGQQYSQQFRVLDESDCAIFLLDHDEGDTLGDINVERLESHEEFLRQVAYHNTSKSRDLADVHFLLNKRDLWGNGPASSKMDAWGSEIISNWKRNSRSRVTSAVHSNLYPDDLAALAKVLRKWSNP